MSVAEIKQELKQLTAMELSELEAAILALKTAPSGFNADPASEGTKPSDFLGCTRGMMTFHPGWEEDELLEMWEALRDDTSL